VNILAELLQIKDLKVSVEGKQILKGINLTINKGEIHVVMGTNGAGKARERDLLGFSALIVIHWPWG